MCLERKWAIRYDNVIRFFIGGGALWSLPSKEEGWVKQNEVYFGDVPPFPHNVKEDKFFEFRKAEIMGRLISVLVGDDWKPKIGDFQVGLCYRVDDPLKVKVDDMVVINNNLQKPYKVVYFNCERNFKLMPFNDDGCIISANTVDYNTISLVKFGYKWRTYNHNLSCDISTEAFFTKKQMAKAISPAWGEWKPVLATKRPVAIQNVATKDVFYVLLANFSEEVKEFYSGK